MSRASSVRRRITPNTAERVSGSRPLNGSSIMYTSALAANARGNGYPAIHSAGKLLRDYSSSSAPRPSSVRSLAAISRTGGGYRRGSAAGYFQQGGRLRLESRAAGWFRRFLCPVAGCGVSAAVSICHNRWVWLRSLRRQRWLATARIALTWQRHQRYHL